MELINMIRRMKEKLGLVKCDVCDEFTDRMHIMEALQLHDTREAIRQLWK